MLCGGFIPTLQLQDAFSKQTTSAVRLASNPHLHTTFESAAESCRTATIFDGWNRTLINRASIRVTTAQLFCVLLCVASRREPNSKWRSLDNIASCSAFEARLCLGNAQRFGPLGRSFVNDANTTLQARSTKSAYSFPSTNKGVTCATVADRTDTVD
jgi:hypothetical protein